MAVTPANVSVVVEFQDNRGFRALTKLSAYDADITADANTIIQATRWASAVGAALQAMSNAKAVRTSLHLDWAYAQEPASETGTYELVIQKAHLQGGDGAGAFMSLSVPAPIDGLFLTVGPSNLIVVDPAAASLVAFQAAVASNPGSYLTPRGGHPFQQFFGGQLRQGHAPIRRTLPSP